MRFALVADTHFRALLRSPNASHRGSAIASVFCAIRTFSGFVTTPALSADILVTYKVIVHPLPVTVRKVIALAVIVEVTTVARGPSTSLPWKASYLFEAIVECHVTACALLADTRTRLFFGWRS